jgi:hypothetical protein
MQKWAIALICLSLSCATHAPDAVPRKLSIPKAIWEPIYFRFIDKVARESGLPSLRVTPVAKGDLELRVWEGFGKSPLQGYVLRKHSGTWSAFVIDAWGSPLEQPGVVSTPTIGKSSGNSYWTLA